MVEEMTARIMGLIGFSNLTHHWGDALIVRHVKRPLAFSCAHCLVRLAIQSHCSRQTTNNAGLIHRKVDSTTQTNLRSIPT